MISRIYKYALKTYKICRILRSFLVFALYMLFPKAKNMCREDAIEDLRITCGRYCDSKVRKNKKLKKIEIPILIPFKKSAFGKCPRKCSQCIDIGSEYNRFELKIYTPKNAKTDYHPGCMVVKIKNTARKYVILIHIPTDDIMASQGLDINHYASVLMFDDEMLVTVWAYHNEKGVIKLG